MREKLEFVPKILKNNRIKDSYIKQKYERNWVLDHNKLDLKKTD